MVGQSSRYSVLILDWRNEGDSNLVVGMEIYEWGKQLDLLGLVCSLCYLNYAEEYEDDVDAPRSWALTRLGQCTGCVTGAKPES